MPPVEIVEPVGGADEDVLAGSFGWIVIRCLRFQIKGERSSTYGSGSNKIAAGKFHEGLPRVRLTAQQNTTMKRKGADLSAPSDSTDAALRRLFDRCVLVGAEAQQRCDSSHAIEVAVCGQVVQLDSRGHGARQQRIRDVLDSDRRLSAHTARVRHVDVDMVAVGALHARRSKLVFRSEE